MEYLTTEEHLFTLSITTTSYKKVNQIFFFYFTRKVIFNFKVKQFSNIILVYKVNWCNSSEHTPSLEYTLAQSIAPVKNIISAQTIPGIILWYKLF